MQIEGAVALVTGANRGIGRAFVTELLARGASKVYAASRSGADPELPGAVPLRLDITDPEQVTAAAEAAPDVTLLIDNAGISTFERLIDGEMSKVRAEFETNFFGTLSMVRAFAPVLEHNGGGAILNVSSAMAWMGYEHSNAYGASKAAVWALSNGLRVELAEQKTQVTTLIVASTDTDMMAWAHDIEKNDPRDVANTALDGIAAGATEVLADDASAALKRSLAEPPPAA
ncbi:SDR family oxidoreductase [Pseudonocardia phyllosphaerae]|uniref:SDR family oxidoreductase n=1 Tax=Pseudonocardia phyllosphaerae TaxID=3390502 RepID=UPI00397A608B